MNLMKNYILLVLAAMFISPLASSAQVVIASTDFDAPVNLVSETLDPTVPFPLGDIWGITTANTDPPVNAPFALVDDSDAACPTFFAGDNQGAVACSYTGNFLGAADTQNGANPMGDVSAEWVFDISGAAALTSISIDMAAMGDFEMLSSGTDDFTFEYSIDGGPFTEVFNLDVDMSNTGQNYTMASGNVVTIKDPLVVDGVTLINQFQTFSKPISGSGNQLTLRLEGITNGGGEAVAFDNIAISGVVAGAPIPTMGQWGMFLFTLIMVTFGLVFVYNAQHRLAVSGMGGVSNSFNTRQLPFEKTTFQSALKIAMALAIPGFVLIFAVWGEIVSADFLGMALAIPVVAYLIHVVKLFGKNE